MEMLHKKAAIQKAFSKIGTANGSSAPESGDNRFGTAYELFVSKELKSMAEKRYEAAKEKAELEGVIDKEKAVEGAEVGVYSSEHFDIALKTSSSSLQLDKTKLKNNLMTKHNMSEKEANKLLVLSSGTRKGAVNINISFK